MESKKTAHPHSILQAPTTQLAKMSIDLKFVKLTADVLDSFFFKSRTGLTVEGRYLRIILHSKAQNSVPPLLYYRYSRVSPIRRYPDTRRSKWLGAPGELHS